MAQIILTNLLNSTITPEDVLHWLTTGSCERAQWISTVDCSQSEFVSHFLNFLQEQSASVLQASNNANQILAKTTPSHVSSVTGSHIKCTKPRRRVSLFGTSKNENSESKHALSGITRIDDSKAQTQNKLSASRANVSSGLHTDNTKTLSKSCIYRNVDSDKSNELQTTVFTNLSFPDKPLEIDKSIPHVGGKGFLAQCVSPHSPNALTSTPLSNKKRISPVNVSTPPASSIGNNLNCSRNEIGTRFSPNNSPRVEGCNDSLLKNVKLEESNLYDPIAFFRLVNTSPFANNSTNAIRQHSNEFKSPSVIEKSNRSQIHETTGHNSASQAEFYQSPVSPLYVNSISSITPKNTKRVHNKSAELHQNALPVWHGTYKSPQHNAINMSKQGSCNLQKNERITPRQSLSLGDFITTDARLSKKGSAKKSNTRMQLLRQCEGENHSKRGLAVTDETFPEMGNNSGRRQRRINPTRLGTSNDKGNKENAIFGVISRPCIVNPQFAETLPTDKPSHRASFETERDLLRLERKKQQINTMTKDTEESAVQNSFSKASSKLKHYPPSITPKIDLVENVEVLNILANLYSGFLDRNLVTNLTKELYFLISLVTLQYLFESNEKHSQLDCLNDKKITERDKLPTTLEDIKEASDQTELRCSVDNVCEGLSCKFDGNVGDKKGFSSENDVLKETSLTPNELNLCKKVDELTISDDSKIDLGCDALRGEVNAGVDKKLDSKSEEELVKGNLYNSSLSSETLDISETALSDTDNIKRDAEKCIDDCTNIKYFRTPHNCVYFSTKVLNTQRNILKVLDRATLKLLSENNRIAAFEPELQEYLKELYNLRLSESSRIKQSYNLSSEAPNVCFQIDTDNRENFPSVIAFQAFRKQRDLFYDVMKIWEDNHLMAGWVFPIALGGKIRTLLTLHNDATNYCHFARLFKSQLLISCIRTGQQEDPLVDESLSFLKNLKHLNPEKLTQLRERLVTPLSSKGPVPLPSFPGIQEFFKDFILHTFNPMFNVHLENCLVHEIIELNDNQFAGSEIEDTETMVDEGTKQNFITCLSSLRLLAKMLGFLESLPYRTESNAIEGVVVTQIELRSNVTPHLNLLSCLQNAARERKLSLTIPWAVKYLAMLDPVALRLPYYKTVLEMLYHIYRDCCCYNDTKRDSGVSQQASVLIKLTLGWLFELPNFPRDLYFNWLSNYTNRNLKSYDDFGQGVRNATITSSVKRTDSLTSNKFRSINLDRLDIIDDKALYECCPFLTEFRILLTSGNASLSSNSSSRHITPVSSELNKSVNGTSKKHLELQLEEAFFHGQPASMRKTVEFISERVASTCVKYICNSLLPPIREESINLFRNVMKEKKEVMRKASQDSEDQKMLVTNEMHSIAADVSKKLKEKCELSIPSMVQTRTAKSIESLLAEDALPPVKEMCTQIAVRMAIERINQWIQSHIVGGSLFIRDMELEANKVHKNNNSTDVFRKREHNAAAASPAAAIRQLRMMIWELLDNNGKILTLDSVSKCLDSLYESLTERADLLPGPERVIYATSLDLSLFLIAYRSDLFVPMIHDKFINLWKVRYLNVSEVNATLARILSPRNIMLLAQPENEEVWLLVGKFIRKMLNANVMCIEAFSDQCVALFRDEWPAPVLKYLSKCLTEGIKDYEPSHEQAGKIKYLLEWMAETCSEIDLQ